MSAPRPRLRKAAVTPHYCYYFYLFMRIKISIIFTNKFIVFLSFPF